MKNFKRTISSLMILMMVITLIPLNVLAEGKEELDIKNAIDNAANWLVENDEITDWVIIDLARINREIPKSSLSEFRNEIEDKKGEFKSATDYARYSLVASSLGLNATDLFGYDFIEKIYNHENVFAEGYSGGIFSLLALDSKNYAIPDNAKWTRENIIKELLAGQKEDGGFAWTKDMGSDVDMTSMAIQALSNYQDKEEVKTATNKALDYLSKNQGKDGGYENEWVGDSSESVAQVLVALTSLDINPTEDERFVKDGNLVDKLLSFQLEDGGFGNKKEDGSLGFTTEQVLRGLVSYERYVNKDFKFYDMKDAKLVELPKEEKVAFSDIDKASDWARESIGKATELGLISGRGNKLFDPKGNITRAEFATILSNLLKLENANEVKGVFSDVKADAWYYDSVMKAYEAGVIQGSGDKFLPNNPITREEMAVMIYRALEINKVVEKQEIKDIDKASHWAIDSINLVYELGIMTGNNNYFNPKGNVTREMAATIVVRIHELD